ncbi:hypothetical protein AYO47_00105 [Planctomyces sp. SCGC AG-212-M04]|nr:hypothetical protein AYO47_00105 [Planctomyces sp. SCGC AG-212-M04]
MGRLLNGPDTYALRWRVESDVLTLGDSSDDQFSRVIGLVYSVFNNEWLSDEVTFHVLAVSENEITVRRDLDSKVLNLYRIPE